jgi:hypothetical protein
MELKLFSDLIDTLGKVVTGLKTIVNLPRDQREKYRQTLDDTYRLIDTTLNMVIIRMGDVLLHSSNKDFLRETAQLENYDEWMQAEREFRLCRGLRAALSETQTLYNQLAGSISTHDWKALLQQMKAILATEGEVAEFIAQRFNSLAAAAQNATLNATSIATVRNEVKKFRQALIAERQQLIKQELDLYTIV